MTKTWMRSAVVATLGWAMLDGTAEATVITYNFSTPITNYYNNTPTGTFAGSFSIDTAILAQSTTSGSNDPDFGYVQYRSFDPAIRPVAVTTAVSGIPDDALANSLLGGAPTYSSNYLYKGTGTQFLNTYGSPYFQLRFEEFFNTDSTAADDTMTSSYDGRVIALEFFGAGTMIVDGYVLPTSGSGTVNALLSRSRGFDQFSSNGDYLGGSYEAVDLRAEGGHTTADTVPEPAALGLLGLGMLGLAIRRRRG